MRSDPSTTRLTCAYARDKLTHIGAVPMELLAQEATMARKTNTRTTRARTDEFIPDMRTILDMYVARAAAQNTRVRTGR